MSDLEDSMVTYTKLSSLVEYLSNIGSSRVDGLPMMPEDPYAYVEAALQASPLPDYMPGPEEPKQAPPLPEFVLEHVYPEFMPLKDDVLPAEEKPLPAAVSPTANSPGYITESDPKEDPKEDDEDLKEDPANYPTDREEDEEEEESSKDNADEGEDKDEDEEEEEHLDPADFVPPPAYRTTAMMSVRAQTSIPLLSETEVARLLSIPTPPPSSLTSYSSPLPQIPSPPLPDSPTYPLRYKAVMIRLRDESPSTSHPPPLHLSTLIKDTTIRDTTIRDTIYPLLNAERMLWRLHDRLERGYALLSVLDLRS
nr:hypothetical protein [Tanacetum cinerariifolium]